MSFITDLLTLLNWNVRRTHSHGGDDSVSTEPEPEQAQEDSEQDHPEFGLEFITDRAAEHDETHPDQPVLQPLPSGKVALHTADKDEWYTTDLTIEVVE